MVESGESGREQPVAEDLHGNGECVLFLDDEEPIVLLAARMLRLLGYRVEPHTKAAEALEAFRRNPADFDIVLTDLAMPGASGMDFARNVLALRPDIPVILTTGYIDTAELELAQRIGVREVILKPTTIQEVGRAFHRQLAARHRS